MKGLTQEHYQALRDYEGVVGEYYNAANKTYPGLLLRKPKIEDQLFLFVGRKGYEDFTRPIFGIKPNTRRGVDASVGVNGSGLAKFWGVVLDNKLGYTAQIMGRHLFGHVCHPADELAEFILIRSSSLSTPRHRGTMLGWVPQNETWWEFESKTMGRKFMCKEVKVDVGFLRFWKKLPRELLYVGTSPASPYYDKGETDAKKIDQLRWMTDVLRTSDNSLKQD